MNILPKNKRSHKQRIAVILLSGGLDSTVLAAYAKRLGYDVHALTVRYGQVLDKELQSAHAVAEKLGLKQRIVDISQYKNVAWYSALTTPELFDIPQNSDQDAKGIPLTYVPLRNTFFIALAAADLESEILKKIEKDNVEPKDIDAKIFIAANALDYSGYPDCRPEYYRKINNLLKLATKASTQYHVSLKVQAPLLNKTKKEIAELGLKLKAPLEWTWSCYVGAEAPCGKCDACQLRAQGFIEAGKEDPLMTRLRKEAKL